jgi:hypothetical protein
MSAPEKTKQIESLLEKLRKQLGGGKGESIAPAPCKAGEAPLWCEADPVVTEFVKSFLLWEAASPRACGAMEAIASSIVDLNELRVSLVEEIVAVIGKNYPRAHERANRLKAALNDVYRREHCVRLAHLLDKNKRDARAYLESLAETPHFVASRTFLVALGGHAMPVDERLLTKLIEADVVDNESATPESTASVLEKAIRSGDSAEAHGLFQVWADEGGGTKTRSARGRGKPRGSGAPVASAKKGSPARRSRSRD